MLPWFLMRFSVQWAVITVYIHMSFVQRVGR